MMDRIDAYAAIAEEIDNIMTETYGDKYDKSVLKAFSFSWANEKEGDAQIKAYGFEVGRDGYDISKEDIRGIALQEIDRTMGRNRNGDREGNREDVTPYTVKLNRDEYRIKHTITDAKVDGDIISDHIKEGIPDKEELDKAYNNIFIGIDQIRAFYSNYRDIIGEDKWNEVMNDINDLEENVISTREKQESIIPEDVDVFNSTLHQLFDRLSPSFTTRTDDEDREIDD